MNHGVQYILLRFLLFLSALVLYTWSDFFGDPLNGLNSLHSRYTYAPSLLLAPAVSLWSRTLPVMLVAGGAIVQLGLAGGPRRPWEVEPTAETQRWRLLLVAADAVAEFAIGWWAASVTVGFYPCCKDHSTGALLEHALIFVVSCGAQFATVVGYKLTLSERVDRGIVDRIHDEMHLSIHVARFTGSALALAHVLWVVVNGVNGDWCIPASTDNRDFVMNCSQKVNSAGTSELTVVAILVATALLLSHVVKTHERSVGHTAIDAQLASFGLVVSLWSCDVQSTSHASEDVLVLSSVCGALLLTSSAANALSQYLHSKDSA